MISFDFDYYKPDTLKNAYETYMKLAGDGKKVFYYAGGTELVTSFRKGAIKADALIDIKDIEGIREITVGDEVVIGACASLNDIIEAYEIPVLKDVMIHIGDHTVRNAISLGGNLCGRLPYKEAVLPLFSLDAKAVIFGEEGFVEKPLKEVFDKRLKLNKGECLYQIKYMNKKLNYGCRRLTESTVVDYPLIHVFVSEDQGNKIVSVSGYDSYPIYRCFTHESLEFIKVYFDDYGKDDKRGSKVYKYHLLMDALEDLFKEMEVSDD